MGFNSGFKGLNVSPEKSHILSCDSVVANELYMEELMEVFHVE